MNLLSNYDLCIFDCDGVILDANTIKINAMAKAVINAGFSKFQAAACKEYFARNFGKSRFVHIRYFVDEILDIEDPLKESSYQKILELFSKYCQTEYINANLTPGFLELLESLDGKKAVASGSEQNELRTLFKKRGLAKHFECILGSPKAKSDNVKEILQSIPHTRAVMVGDAKADFEAALANNIDFIGYIPFSNVMEEMKALSEEHSFHLLDEWLD